MGDLYGQVDIVETVRITPEGKIQTIYRVTAVSKSGVTFHLEIPEEEFTEELVAKKLTEKAKLLEKIKGL